jgi:hypothetical protein
MLQWQGARKMEEKPTSSVNVRAGYVEAPATPEVMAQHA